MMGGEGNGSHESVKRWNQFINSEIQQFRFTLFPVPFPFVNCYPVRLAPVFLIAASLPCFPPPFQLSSCLMPVATCRFSGLGLEGSHNLKPQHVLLGYVPLSPVSLNVPSTSVARDCQPQSGLTHHWFQCTGTSDYHVRTDRLRLRISHFTRSRDQPLRHVDLGGWRTGNENENGNDDDASGVTTRTLTILTIC